MDKKPWRAFKEGFSSVICINMPKRRELMHLDTILTRISQNECILFPPLFFGLILFK